MILIKKNVQTGKQIMDKISSIIFYIYSNQINIIKQEC